MAIYKRDRGVKLGATEKQIQAVARTGLEPGTAGWRVRHADHLATLPVVSAAVHGSVKELAKMKTAVHRFH